MDNLINVKIDKNSIYEIYRACRLCGAGAGYKMPIIQNVVDLDSNEVELKQKIRDCVQIEVNPDDKMPPLICELCVDKVNDFYEFMEVCQQTNKRTRMRLGLPLQTSGKVRNANYDSGDCILGVTEPVYGNEDSDEPLSSNSKRPKIEPKVKIKVEKDEDNPTPRLNKSQNSRSRPESNRDTRSRPENSRNSRTRPENSRNPQSKPNNSRDTRSDNSRESRLKTENSRESRSRVDNSRSSRSRLDSSEVEPRVTRLKRPPTPPRLTRQGMSSQEENVSLSNLKQQQGKKSVNASPPAPPKSILKKDSKSEDLNKSKRLREATKCDVPNKKVKLSMPPAKVRLPTKPPAPDYSCSICRKSNSTAQGLSNHMRAHNVTYTNIKLSCNACRLWFSTADEAAAHHKSHKGKLRPYQCRRCDIKFSQLQGYDDHIENGECVPWIEVPDVKCPECWRTYPTQTLLDQHKCGGVDSRVGGKCVKCRRSYALLKNLNKHLETCTAKRKSDLIVAPGVMERLQPVQIRIVRCDRLLENVTNGHCNVSDVEQGHDLDPNCVYPYHRASQLARDHMVNIKSELDYCDELGDLVHWDSEYSGSDDDSQQGNTVDSLITLSLKKIFSKQLLGRVPRRRRKVKNVFDSILNTSIVNHSLGQDIDNIIDKLGYDDSFNYGKDRDNVSENSESLLYNDVAMHSDLLNNSKFNDNFDSGDSQSLLVSDRFKELIDGIDSKDGNTTDCETEVEGEKGNVECEKLDAIEPSSNEIEDGNVNQAGKLDAFDVSGNGNKTLESSSNENKDGNENDRLDTVEFSSNEIKDGHPNESDRLDTVEFSSNEIKDGHPNESDRLDPVESSSNENKDAGVNKNDKPNTESKSKSGELNTLEFSSNEIKNDKLETLELSSDKKDGYVNNSDNLEILNVSSNVNNDISSTECIVHNDSVTFEVENHFNDTNSDLNVCKNKDDLQDESIKINNKNSNNLDVYINGKTHLNSASLCNENKDTKITEINESNYEEKSGLKDERLTNDINNHVGDCSYQNEESTENNNKDSLTNDKVLSNDESITNEFTKNNDESADERWSVNCNNENHLNTENNVESQSAKENREQNEAICNDIENKINDLIALRNNAENNDWIESNSVNNMKNDESVESNANLPASKDVTQNNYSISQKSESVSEKNERFSQNNDGFSQNNDEFSQNNDIVDGDKISLDDLIPSKNSGGKSLDLDSISDDEFDFDA